MTHSHTEPSDDPATWWEDRYASGTMRWSGKPNDLLVREVEALEPGRALDLGCGTGGDAIWLAGRGWQVTGVDIAASALEQAAAHAAAAGVADHISWEQHDFERSFPTGEFDLVTACYLQSPLAFERIAALRLAARAVARGGTLVIVSHESVPSGAHADPHRSMPTAQQLLDELALPTSEWSLETVESVERTRRTPQNEHMNYRDNVLRVRHTA